MKDLIVVRLDETEVVKFGPNASYQPIIGDDGNPIIGPDGHYVAGPIYDEPTILTAELSLDRVREELMSAVVRLVEETGIGCILVEQHVADRPEAVEEILRRDRVAAIAPRGRIWKRHSPDFRPGHRQHGQRAASVGEIERQLQMPQTTVSKHLRVLREAGFVEATVDAQRRLYRLKPEPLQEIDAWLAQFRRFWSAHVDALERHLDALPD